MGTHPIPPVLDGINRIVEEVRTLCDGLGLPHRIPRARCARCNCPYGSHGFVDLIVPDWAWEKISPTGDSHGLLCPTCIIASLEGEGLRDVPVYFASGPATIDPGQQQRTVVRRWAYAKRNWEVYKEYATSLSLIASMEADHITRRRMAFEAKQARDARLGEIGKEEQEMDDKENQGGIMVAGNSPLTFTVDPIQPHQEVMKVSPDGEVFITSEPDGIADKHIGSSEALGAFMQSTVGLDRGHFIFQPAGSMNLTLLGSDGVTRMVIGREGFYDGTGRKLAEWEIVPALDAWARSVTGAEKGSGDGE